MSHDEQHHHEDGIARSSLLLRLLWRIYQMISIHVPDEDARKLMQKDVKRAFHTAERDRKEKIRFMDKRRGKE